MAKWFTTVQEKLKHFYSHDIKRDRESESEECKNNIHKTAPKPHQIYIHNDKKERSNKQWHVDGAQNSETVEIATLLALNLMCVKR